MDQVRRLKLSAVVFAVVWVGGMLWRTGEYDPAYVILLAVCGAVAGYLWYLGMRWMMPRMHLLTRKSS